MFFVWNYLHNLIFLTINDKKATIYIISFLHAFFIVLCSTISLVLYDITYFTIIMSISYFIHDLKHSKFIFILHHILSIILLISFFYHDQYVHHINLFLFFGEITGVMQNYMFIHKQNMTNKQFNRKFLLFFKFYAYSFFICRLIIIPFILSIFIYKIEETYYKNFLIFSFIIFTCGNLYWIKGQRSMYKNMCINTQDKTN